MKYVFQEDQGYRPASARNKAIRLAEGRICLLIDASVMLDPNCISEHVLFHRKNESAAAIGYVYGFDHNEESEDLLKNLVTTSDPENSIKRLSQYKVFHDVRESHYKKYNDNIHLLPAPWFYFWTCHVSIATIDLLMVGLFDEAYDGRWGCEDNDLGFRLQLSGVDIHLLRNALSIHYPHGKDKVERQKEGQENCVYFYNKFPTIEIKLFLDYYVSGAELIDINEISVKMSSNVVSI